MKGNIVKVLISSVIMLAFCSCTQKVKTEQKTNTIAPTTQTKKTQASKNVKKAAPDFVRITDDNVVEELTKYGEHNRETKVRISTSMGDMIIKLYDNTPLHRANFVRLVKEKFYDGTEFYRVINNFMIQGGDTDDWERRAVKNRMGKYTLPPEFKTDNIHKRGAVSMVREYENNPEQRSSAYEFFIVQGEKYTDGQLNGAEYAYDIKINQQHRAIYKQIGGCVHLDGKHTVFGEVVDGLDVIDKIAAVKTDDGDWPIEAVKMVVEVIE